MLISRRSFWRTLSHTPIWDARPSTSWRPSWRKSQKWSATVAPSWRRLKKLQLPLIHPVGSWPKMLKNASRCSGTTTNSSRMSTTFFTFWRTPLKSISFKSINVWLTYKCIRAIEFERSLTNSRRQLEKLKRHIRREEKIKEVLQKEQLMLRTASPQIVSYTFAQFGN